MVDISIIMPVYNLERHVSSSLKTIKRVLDSSFPSYELVVVNDGSHDGTLHVLKNEESLDPRVRVISYMQNQGKGYAIKMGVRHSCGKIIAFVDGDLEVSPDVLRDYVNELGSCDVVVASKRHPLSKRNFPKSRRFLSWTFNLVVRIAVGIKVKDTQTGLKLGTAAVIRKIFGIMLIKRFAFDVELLTIATALDLKIKELPIEVNGTSHGMKAREILRMFLDVATISYRYRIIHWYQRQLRLKGIEESINATV
jgi:glycosyltransferase involved in cell wall biosynthesis